MAAAVSASSWSVAHLDVDFEVIVAGGNAGDSQCNIFRRDVESDTTESDVATRSETVSGLVDGAGSPPFQGARMVPVDNWLNSKL